MRILNDISFSCILDFFRVLSFLFLSNLLLSQYTDDYHWNQVSIPDNSNLEYIKMFSATSGVVSGNKIMVLKDKNWTLLSKQPPIVVSRAFALDPNSIFVTNDNKFQESELLYWNGKDWKKVYHPLANSIISMNFKDEKNGIIAGYGEVAILKEGKWNLITPPTNFSIFQVFQQNDSVIWALTVGRGLFKYSNNWKEIKNSSNIQSISFFNNKVYFATNKIIGKIENDLIIEITELSKLESTYIKSLSISDSNDIFCLNYDGKILHYKFGNWIIDDVNTALNYMSIINYNDKWVVGNEGAIFHYTNQIGDEIHQNWKGFEVNSLFISINAKVVDDEYGIAIADFNGDGLSDIFTCGLYEENHLYINNLQMEFFDEARKRGVNGTITKIEQELNLGASAVDWDNDGDVDLYVSVLNGKNKLYENMGEEYFIEYSDISNGVGESNDRTNACSFGDVDNDGDLDLFITNEHSSNRLFNNNGVGVFKEITTKVGLASNRGGMACSFGDIDNDGDIDLYVANWSESNRMYKNLLKETGELKFEDVTIKSKTGGFAYTKSNAVVFADIDNDADLDLYVTNRKTSNRLYINDGKGIFTDKTKDLVGLDSMKSNGVVIADFDGNGWKDIYVSNVGENIYFENVEGVFAENGTNRVGYSTGSAYSDFDNDGDLDIYIANYVGESSVLLINKLNNENYIKISIEGVKNNRSGVGSKIYVYKDTCLNKSSDLIDFRQITAGSGYASMNDFNQSIQIQDDKFVDIKVIFPDGTIKTKKHILAGTKLIISDTKGIKRLLIFAKKMFLRRVFDPHELFELIKWIFILSFIFYITLRGIIRYKWSRIFALGVVIVSVLFYFFQYYFLEYENFLYSTLLPFSSVIGMILLMYQFFERNHTKKMALVEQEQIREKLSRDLHDDLASTISSIGIYLTLIRYKLTGKEGKLMELLDKSESLVGDATTSITDMIWAIKPKPESLANLIIRINNNFAELFRAKNVNYQSFVNLIDDKVILQPKVKQNIYLIIKEALNNTLKYAKAKNVSIEVQKENSKVKIIIEDDGIGFDYNFMKGRGHGLINMKKRAEDIGAGFQVITEEGKGTKCIIEFDG